MELNPIECLQSIILNDQTAPQNDKNPARTLAFEPWYVWVRLGTLDPP